MIGRVIAAWPSFALTASYELLTRQVRCSAISHAGGTERKRTSRGLRGARLPAVGEHRASVPGLRLVRPRPASEHAAGRDLQRQAWQWALANQARDGSLPSGKEIPDRFGRHERWGRLVKRAGSTGELSQEGEPIEEEARAITAVRSDLDLSSETT
jgi:hypothetical protein